MGTQNNLNEYLKSVKNTPFKFGEHDCLTFTNSAYRAMYGTGWAEDLLGRYMSEKGVPLGRGALKETFGYQTFESAVDDRLITYKGVPPRGALVTTTFCRKFVIGVAMGISVGTSAVFLSGEGLISLPIEMIDKAWTHKP